jgi:hypothetical protein
LQATTLRYGHAKQGHEVDFVWTPRGRPPVAIECKWSVRDFDPASLAVFACAYPKAELRVVAHDAQPGFTREHGGLKVRFVSHGKLAGKFRRRRECRPGGGVTQRRGRVARIS